MKGVLIAMFLHLVSCIHFTRPGITDLWPVLYYNTEKPNPDLSTIDLSSGHFMRKINDAEYVPQSVKLYRLSNSTKEYQEGIFRAKLCKSSNCKPSYDKWNCDECKDFMPDGVVLRSFSTFPLGTTGFIVISESSKTLHVVLRGASSIRSKIQFSIDELVLHPFIPDAYVRQGLLNACNDISDIVYNTIHDQLLLHPDFKVDVTGHSFGAGVGSLIMADLYHRIPQLNSTNLHGYLMGKPRVGNFYYAKYFDDEKLKIIRYIEGTDEIPHAPDIRDGFVHEGDEYWIREQDQEIVVCPGPYESRNCSNSVIIAAAQPHLIYFSIKQNCDTDFYNFI